MILFFMQRSTRFSRSMVLLFYGLAISCFLSLGVHAESIDELFRGTWQIETQEKGTLIIMVKSQGRASYFWGDNTDRTVYTGTWTSDGNIATLTGQIEASIELKATALALLSPISMQQAESVT